MTTGSDFFQAKFALVALAQLPETSANTVLDDQGMVMCSSSHEQAAKT
jgi:hypothetical protein